MEMINKTHHNDTASIVLAMMQYMDDASHQEFGCRTLSKLAFEDKYKYIISREGGIEAIICAMKTHPSHAGVQQEACSALLNLTYHNRENINTVPSEGGLEVIVHAMKNHSEQAGIQEATFKILYNLACDNENKTLISNSGAIELMIDTMKRHVSHVGVQREACRTLRNLIYHHDQNSMIISRLGGISAIIHAMKYNLFQADIQIEALKALFNLAFEENNRRQISLQGGIQVIIESMKQNMQRADVQKQACMTIYYLIFNDENRVTFSKQGGIQITILVMKSHSNDMDVQNILCKIIRILASESIEDRKQLANAGTIYHIITMMKTYLCLPHFLKESCNALNHLTHNYLENQINLSKRDIEESIPIIIRAMKNNRDFVDVQRKACELLNNLVKSDVGRVILFEKNGVQAIIFAMETYPNEFKLQLEACKLLEKLSVIQPFERTLVKNGGIDVIMKSAKEYAASISLIESVLNTLLTLSWSVDKRLSVSSENTIRAITNGMLLHMSNASFQKKAYILLRKFSLNRDDKRVIMRNGIHVIMHGMDQYVPYEDLQEEGCKLLSHLVKDEIFNIMKTQSGHYALSFGYEIMHEIEISSEDIIKIVINAMLEFPKNADIQETACDTLYGFAINDDNNIIISTNGGIYAVLKAMKRHLKSHRVQKVACKLLCKLSLDEHNAIIITRMDGIHLIITTMKIHTGQRYIQQKAWNILHNLTGHNEKLKQKILDEDRFQSIISAAMNNSEDKDLLNEAESTLRNLCCERNSNENAFQRMKAKVFFKDSFYAF